jgi:hypothetical protein
LELDTAVVTANACFVVVAVVDVVGIIITVTANTAAIFLLSFDIEMNVL